MKALNSAEPQTASERENDVQTGLYAELASQPVPEGHSFLFIPSLAAILTRAEEQKDSPLTEAEVLNIRDQAPAGIFPNDVILKMNQSRQYEDINPASCWNEWLELRSQLD